MLRLQTSRNGASGGFMGRLWEKESADGASLFRRRGCLSCMQSKLMAHIRISKQLVNVTLPGTHE